MCLWEALSISKNKVGIPSLARKSAMTGSFGRSSSTRILWMLALSPTSTVEGAEISISFGVNEVVAGTCQCEQCCHISRTGVPHCSSDSP